MDQMRQWRESAGADAERLQRELDNWRAKVTEVNIGLFGELSQEELMVVELTRRQVCLSEAKTIHTILLHGEMLLLAVAETKKNSEAKSQEILARLDEISARLSSVEKKLNQSC